MQTYKVLSVLLMYPDKDWVEQTNALEGVLRLESKVNRSACDKLKELMNFLRENSLMDLQSNYVTTFDQTPGNSLHLFEHVHGESRDRGQAMVDLLEEYSRHGMEITAAELPDYVPLFLEYISLLSDQYAQSLVDDAIDVLSVIGGKLRDNGSPYSAVFAVLESIATRTPRPHAVAPVRDMDETMAYFGPNKDGQEPLMTPQKRYKVAVANVPKPGQVTMSRWSH